MSTFLFGKHKGEDIDQVSPDYLRWLVSEEICQLMSDGERAYESALAELERLGLDPYEDTF